MPTVFEYQKEHSKIKDVIYRPVGEITLKTDEQEVRVPMYIDSGADITIIPRIRKLVNLYSAI